MKNLLEFKENLESKSKDCLNVNPNMSKENFNFGGSIKKFGDLLTNYNERWKNSIAEYKKRFRLLILNNFNN